MLIKSIVKSEFIKNPSKYIKWTENSNELIITHKNIPNLILTKIKQQSIKQLQGKYDVKVYGDINEHVFAMTE